jgi:RNA polymerase sigma-70 factor (ECF subfamily)
VDIEEQTMAEAAAVLGVPQGTVASRLRRARELFERHAAELKARIEGESR